LQDTQILYHLKQMLQNTGSEVPAELARNPAANVKPGTVEQKRRETVIFAK
jgi:ATP-dependent RNA helicase DDX23/PRP28